MSERRTNILLVDDSAEDLPATAALRENPALNIVKAASRNEAISLAPDHDFALAILDADLLEINAFEVAEAMRADERTRTIPIIFVTGASRGREHAFAGHEAGAVDCLLKPIDPRVLHAKVDVFLELKKQLQSLETVTNELERTVGQLREANETVHEQQRRLAAEARCGVLRQMAGASAHDLTQPLLGLLGATESLRTSADFPPGLGEELQTSTACAERIRDIVLQMQSIHRHGPAGHVVCDSAIEFDREYRVLVIEDQEEPLAALESMLGPDRDNFTLDRATSCADAERKMAERTYDLIFADYLLPDGTTLDLLDAERAGPAVPPVIMITGKGNESVAIEAMRRGVYDYLPKHTLDAETLRKSIWWTLERVRLEWDVVEANQRVAELATRDELTGLFNRRYLLETLEAEVVRADRYGTDLTVCMLDLDDFKQVNDQYGHKMGDEVLARSTRTIGEVIRGTDFCGRYGGEEFVIVFPQTALASAGMVLERVREQIEAETYSPAEGVVFNVTASIGAAQYDKGMGDTDNLLKIADDAMYLAKKSGRNRVHLG